MMPKPLIHSFIFSNYFILRVMVDLEPPSMGLMYIAENIRILGNNLKSKSG